VLYNKASLGINELLMVPVSVLLISGWAHTRYSFRRSCALPSALQSKKQNKNKTKKQQIKIFNASSGAEVKFRIWHN